mgnify:CR=1 FL=1
MVTNLERSDHRAGLGPEVSDGWRIAIKKI